MTDWDRLKKAFDTFINTAMRRVDFYALYPAKVIAQKNDLTLELQPEDVRFQALLPGLTKVPIRLGIPGAKVTVQVGGRVLLGFEAGNQQAPVALLWDTSVVTKLEIDANEVIFNGGTKKVAREDDSISAGTLTGTCPAGAVTFTHTPPGGAPTAGLTATLTGKVTTGANGVKA